MIPIYQPYLPKESLKYAHDAIDSGWISSQGQYKDMVEDKLKSLLSIDYVLLLNNGTSAVHLMSRALTHHYKNIKNIIVPNNAYVAAWNGFIFDKKLKLLPIDADINTWNMDVDLIDGYDDNTTAILVVHNVGGTVNVPALIRKHPQVTVLEDACEGFLGKYEGDYVGTASVCSALSFFGNKNITCLPGGTQIPIEGTTKGSGKKKTKSIENIQVGDLVWSRSKEGNKELDTVIRTMSSQTQELYKIKFSNNNEITITGNHEIFVHNKGWIPANNISMGDKVIQLLYHGLSARTNNLYQKGKKYTDYMSEEKAINKALTHSMKLKKTHKKIDSGYNTPDSLYMKKQIDKNIKIQEHYKPENVKQRYDIGIKKRSDYMKARWLDPIYREQTTIKVNVIRNTPEYIEHYCKGLNMKPNKAEVYLQYILNELGIYDYKYNGDGTEKININGSPPDFINHKQNKLIYFNGCSWHCCPSCNYQKNPRNILANVIQSKDARILKECIKRGYQVLTIWEHEFKNIDNLKEKLLNFHYNPEAITIDVIGIEKIKLEEKITVYNIETEKNHNYFAHGILVHNCGEGGALITNDKDIYDFAKKLQGQGQSDIRYIHDELGYNYRMTNIQAALLYGQLECLDEIMEKKKKIFDYYREVLPTIPHVVLQKTDIETDPSNWMMGVRIADNKKGYSHVENHFRTNGVDIRPMFYPMTKHKHLKGISNRSYEHVANILSKECFMLPSYPELKDADLEKIYSTLKCYVKKYIDKE